jgi:hypothetical protein
MPSNNDILILPIAELTLSTKMNNHDCNGICQELTPQDILNNHAEQWQIPIASEAFARKLDENDPLHHVRDEFYIPKNRTLPKGIFIYNKFFNMNFDLYI